AHLPGGELRERDPGELREREPAQHGEFHERRQTGDYVQHRNHPIDAGYDFSVLNQMLAWRNAQQ
ncbi:hypothetical protein AAHS21_27625, partial [Mycobacterium sp. 050272]|uniref:hypothetical protein n=1 Tax=Mycobacterium sp. 050272 TaxID=3142488 RepID=UPI003187DA77